MKYNWQQRDWSDFKYDASSFEAIASQFREIGGRSTNYQVDLEES